MSSKSQCSSISVLNMTQNSKLEKKLRFNEENIQQTHHPVQKDYGFIAIPEAKTPFPRHGDPISAEDLRKRLQESLDRANRMMLNDNTDDERSFNMDELQTPLASLDFEDQERRRSEFYKKRKKFYQSEYIIAQQKSMSTEMPEPGPSIGENWRIVNNDGNYSLPSTFNSFINNNRQSTVNYETLREIAEQMSSSSEQFI
ncbi:hypothetical protein FF38_05022 [Lucilia cuprina]|uniref:Uncharacterized protein n=1 Tax=Lucilia cuprina TaxID=7375 RepID=A0A0L0CLY8_LUCCU|nr:hypothetical protein CVS40_0707 [Lucilia cuprina]KNC32449.1 hypothetical protein FF38_05022 [Lucilia cuprina]